MQNRVIPVLRIFDYAKTLEFYQDWLGFKVDWEHRFSDRAPLYIQASREHITLHLSEHHGDCSPGAKVFIEFTGLKDYHKELRQKNYKFNAPDIEKAPWNALCVEVTDPFSNKLLFSESLESDHEN